MRIVLHLVLALFLMLPLPDLSALAGEATNNKWNNLAWAEMKPDEKANWGVLGWSEEAWDSGNSSQAPVSESQSWSELTKEQQNAALQLGYSEQCWNDQ